MNDQIKTTVPVADVNDDNFETETGWTRQDAVAMALECQRDARIFGKPARARRTRRPSTPASRAAAFLKRTGWTLQDAFEMAIECRREQRLFGSLS